MRLFSTFALSRLAVFALLAAAVSGLGLAGPATAETSVSGHALLRGQGVESTRSWRDGGFGRLDLGDDPGTRSDDTRGALLGKLHLAVDWRNDPPLDPEDDSPTVTVGAHLHAVARAEPSSVRGRDLGLVEAYLEASRFVGDADRIVARAGHFLLSTSRENLEPAWGSPYSSTFSALNSWIAEEVRPTGVEVEYHRAVGAIDTLRFSAAVFGGNDTAGTLLAWRGWALGDRLSGFGETLPLPPLPGLDDQGGFAPQRDDGTRPLGEDLDGRAGWAASVHWERPGRAGLQWTRYDNRGDRELHGDKGREEYAWATRFDLVGADWHSGAWTFATEWMVGSTGMGRLDGAAVRADFEASYALASWGRLPWRVTLRVDEFETIERDGTVVYDPNDGSGRAVLLALAWEPVDRPLRLTVELLDLEAERAVTAFVDDAPRDLDARSVLVEIRTFLDGLWSGP